MFRKKSEVNSVDKAKLNEVINILSTILKMTLILGIVVSIYIFIIIFKELKLGNIIMTILSIISPLFIGFVIAWLMDPIVTKLQKKGVRRGLGTTLTYVFTLTILGVIIGTIIPVLTSQINDFVSNIPEILNTIMSWIDDIFVRLNTIEGFDALAVKENVLGQISDFGANLTNSLPELTISMFKSFISALGKILVGMIIGFYLLINFNSAEETIITLLPKNMRNDASSLLKSVNTTFRSFVTGAILDCTLIFVVSSIAFIFTGLKAPLLFGLFCGITNVIPYAGPYIGGAPAVIVGFSISPTCGILTLVVIFVIQALEGNFLQPLIMARTTKLHPVTFMLGLLVFGHFFGIIGIIIATPVIGACKAIFLFFNQKYNFINFKKEVTNES